MKSIAFWFIFLGTVFALGGMAWGIQMSASMDHTLASAHAHNNLIGWVTMCLYGLYYARVPVAGAGRLALAHFALAVVGAATIGIGVAMAITGQGELLAQIASFATIGGMLVFSINVYRNRAALAG